MRNRSGRARALTSDGFMRPFVLRLRLRRLSTGLALSAVFIDEKWLAHYWARVCVEHALWSDDTGSFQLRLCMRRTTAI